MPGAQDPIRAALIRRHRTRPAEFDPEEPLFEETLAIFLRHNRHAWRMRRVDRFEPVEIVLARQHITLQGVITRDLLAAFAAAHGGHRGVNFDYKRVHTLTAFVPALSLAKRLLLDFDARDDGDRAVPMLSRAEGSQWTALSLLGPLIQWKDDGFTELNDLSRAPSLTALLATFAAVNPHRLADRILEWTEKKDDFELNRGLTQRDLIRWVQAEAEDFAPGMGDVVVNAVRDEIQRQFRPRGGARGIPRFGRPDGLAYFPTYGLLLLHGIQDLLKAIIQAADPWKPAFGDGGMSQRAALMVDPGSLGEDVRRAVAQLPLLERLMASQKTPAPEAEVIRHLDRWIAYVPIPIRVNVPFVLKFTQMLPLGPPLSEVKRREKWRLLRHTTHEYPLAERDAAAVHIEVNVSDPELKIAGQAEVFEERGVNRDPVSVVFGHEVRPTGRLLHRYSSKRPEGNEPDEPFGDFPRELYCRVKLELVNSIKWGYVGTFVGFALVAFYVMVVLLRAVWQNEPLKDPIPVLTAGALALSLTLWLSTVQNKGAIVYRKLFVARRVFYVALVAIVGSTILYLASRTIDAVTRSSPDRCEVTDSRGCSGDLSRVPNPLPGRPERLH